MIKKETWKAAILEKSLDEARVVHEHTGITDQVVSLVVSEASRFYRTSFALNVKTQQTFNKTYHFPVHIFQQICE